MEELKVQIENSRKIFKEKMPECETERFVSRNPLLLIHGAVGGPL